MYQIAIVENPYFTIHSSEFAKQIFPEIISMKIKGYQSFHSNRCLPLGLDDFLSDHILILKNGKLVAGIKFIDFNTMADFNIDFPMMSWLKDKRNPVHLLKKVESFVKENKDKNICYLGAYTRVPHEDQDNKMINRLISISIANLYKDKKCEMLMCAGMTTGISFLRRLGAEFFFEDKVLLNSLDYKPAQIVYLDKFSNSVENDLSSLNPYWVNRIDVSAGDDKQVNRYGPQLSA